MPINLKVYICSTSVLLMDNGKIGLLLFLKARKPPHHGMALTLTRKNEPINVSKNLFLKMYTFSLNYKASKGIRMINTLF